MGARVAGGPRRAGHRHPLAVSVVADGAARAWGAERSGGPRVDLPAHRGEGRRRRRGGRDAAAAARSDGRRAAVGAQARTVRAGRARRRRHRGLRPRADVARAHARRVDAHPGRPRGAADARAARVALRDPPATSDASSGRRREEAPPRAAQRPDVRRRRRRASSASASPAPSRRRPRALRRELADQRARPLQGQEPRSPRAAHRHGPGRLPAARTRRRRCRPRRARRAATTSGSPCA